jgi:carbamate kinase
MKPKIESVISYLEAQPNGSALITDSPRIADALRGEDGTWIRAR